ncbi:MAG: hypothetical protein MZV70_34035 [Desulfobacterales bacterium]|nr:hypothetical protein [Desulfobacterales bacterium]
MLRSLRRAGRRDAGRRRRRCKRARRLRGRRAARAARHRGRSDHAAASTSCSPAMLDARVAHGPEPRPRRADPAPCRSRRSTQIGVFDLESVLPGEGAHRAGAAHQQPARRARLRGLARRASRSTSQRLLYTADGKPRIAIISIAHLNDAERMFVVTLLLERGRRRGCAASRARPACARCSTWTRCSASSRRSAMPPSKLPLLTLLKQARAFGLGVVLATQNPVDLDYKGLGNAGTWFIGRLQTERDKARVLEGLLGSDAAGGLDRAGVRSADVEPARSARS